MPDRYDVVIIGAGPGGYVAAIRATQLGLKTACIESRASLGGTCLNIGCIPSKALLQSSEKFAEAGHALAEHGVKVGEVGLDLGAMMGRKDKVVTPLTRGVEFLFRKNKVDWLKGKGRVVAPGRIAMAGADGAAREVDAHQQGVQIAVRAHCTQDQLLSAGFTLGPKLLARAAVKRHKSCCPRKIVSLAIHEAEHQNFAVLIVLHDGGNQPAFLLEIEFQHECRFP